MTIAILSDVHEDIDRLQTAYGQLNSINPKDIYVLGDMLRFGVTPGENSCLDFLRDREVNVVRGNHEDLALNIRKLLQGASGRSGMDENISPENIQYLEGLPLQISRDDYMFSHTIEPGGDRRVIDTEHAKVVFDYMAREQPGVKVWFIGHSHESACFYYDASSGEVGNEKGDKILLKDDRVYIVNPGSLGKGDIGSFVLFNPENGKIERKTLR